MHEQKEFSVQSSGMGTDLATKNRRLCRNFRLQWKDLVLECKDLTRTKFSAQYLLRRASESLQPLNYEGVKILTAMKMRTLGDSQIDAQISLAA